MNWRNPPDHGDWMLFALVVQVWLWVLYFLR